MAYIYTTYENASQEIKDAIDGNGRKFSLKVVFDDPATQTGHTYLGHYIKTVKITKGSCGGEPVVGSVFIPSAYIELNESWYTDVAIGQEVRIDCYINDIADYIEFGEFIVSKVTTANGIAKIEAVGTLSTIGSQQSSVSNTTVAGVIDDITTGTGEFVQLIGVTTSGVEPFDEPPTGTWLEVMQTVALKLGGFVTENGGNWVISKFLASVVDAQADRFRETPTFDVAQDYTLCGRSVQSASVDMAMGNPLLNPWNALNIWDVDGNSHLLPCLKITHTLDGGAETSIDATVDSSIQQEATITGPVTKNMQHFWVDADGAHVTAVAKDEYLGGPSSAGGNTLITSDGMQVRNGEDALAKFEANSAQIGEDLGQHLVMTPSQLEFYASHGTGEELVAKLLFTSDDGDFPVPTYIQASEGTGIEHFASDHVLHANTTETVFLPNMHIASKLHVGCQSLEYYTYTVDSSGEAAPELEAFSIDVDGKVCSNSGFVSKRGGAADVTGGFRTDGLTIKEIRPSSNVAFTSTSSNTRIACATNVFGSNNWLTLNSNGTVTVNAGCYVKVWGFAYITGLNSGDAIYMIARQNGVSMTNQYYRAAGSADSFVLMPSCFGCSAGDVLDFAGRNSTGVRGSVQASTFTKFSIQVMAPR